MISTQSSCGVTILVPPSFAYAVPARAIGTAQTVLSDFPFVTDMPELPLSALYCTIVVRGCSAVLPTRLAFTH